MGFGRVRRVGGLIGNANPACGMDIAGTQNTCTRDKGHAGEHRCKAGDVDARRAGRPADAIAAESAFDLQADRERKAAHVGLVRIMRRAIASQDGELFQAARAIEIVLGDVTAADLEAARFFHPADV